MTDACTEVRAPLLSVNEPEAQVVDVVATSGMKVRPGDLLCTLETTKTTFDVQCEVDGYVRAVLIAKGQRVSAGALLFELADVPQAHGPSPASHSAGPAQVEPTRPEGLLITEKAARLAATLSVPLNSLPLRTLVTEAMIYERSGARPPVPDDRPAFESSAIGLPFDANQLVIMGAAGHAKTIIDLVRQARQYRIVGIVAEPRPAESDVLGVPVLGGEEVLPQLVASGIRLMANGVGAIESNRIRAQVFARMATQGFAFPRLVHPGAVVEASAEIDGGAQICGRAFVGSAARIGFGAIVGTGATVSHDCVVGESVHLTPGVILAGRVEVGTGALLGMGVTTLPGVVIGEWARVGNGACILKDVPPHTIVQTGVTWR